MPPLVQKLPHQSCTEDIVGFCAGCDNPKAIFRYRYNCVNKKYQYVCIFCNTTRTEPTTVNKIFPALDDTYKDFMPPDENKLDQGKYMAGVLEDFLPALKEVAKLGSMNNKPFGKYNRGSWMLVEDAEQRYLDGFWRHINEGRFNIDPESGMPHDVAICWNSLALIWFRLKREGKI